MPLKRRPDTAWIGVDLGTQSVRALVVSETGQVLGVGSQRLTSRRDGPRHEQDPEEWWSAVALACREALRLLSTNLEIGGIAVDATSGTVLLTDDRGQPLTPGLMYDDTRAVAEAKRANELGNEVWEKMGYNRMQPAWGLPKLLWLLSENDLGSRTRLAHQSDFINRRLVGAEVATDTSNALKTGVDLVVDRWPEEVFSGLGVPIDVIPSIVRSGTVLGVVSPAAAGQTNIPAGTPVIAGMTDGCASQIGAGALKIGSWNSVLGTTLVLKGVSPTLIKDPGGVVYCHRSPDDNWLPGGASSAGAGAMAKLFPDRDLDALTSQAAARGRAKVVTYPLHGRGERFPFVAPEAEGFSLGTPEDELERYTAVLEGVAFVERLCFDYLDLLGAPVDGALLFTGGGAKNKYWSQLRADTLNRQVSLPENAEAAFGMAILAAANGRELSQVAGEMVRIREVIDPSPNRASELTESFLRLIDELERRGWLAPNVMRHARGRATA